MKEKSIKIYHLLLLILISFCGCREAVNQDFKGLPEGQSQKQETKQTPTSTSEIDMVETDEDKDGAKEVARTIPEVLDYQVPFVSQAPYAVWDQLHEESCEEAAMIIVDKYFKAEKLTAHDMEQAILNLVRWEEENGYKVDLTADEAAEILTDYFGLKAEVIEEVTVERIRSELSNGRLIIVPAAGRQLGNPYFQTPGPIYHMLVIRGYNESEFITNDPGTKRGEGFKYEYQKLLNAVHDWNHELAKDGMTDQEMDQGRKAMLVIFR